MTTHSGLDLLRFVRTHTRPNPTQYPTPHTNNDTTTSCDMQVMPNHCGLDLLCFVRTHTRPNPTKYPKPQTNNDTTTSCDAQVMPNHSGLDLLRFVRSHQELRNLPVVMMSANHQHECISECISSGAEDFLVGLMCVSPCCVGVLLGV
jgi:hypothetical protein